MNANYFSQPKELISSDLEGILPEDESDQESNLSFIAIVFVAVDKEDSIMGSLIGIDFSQVSLRVDVKASIENSFLFMSKMLTNQMDRNLDSVILNFEDSVTNVPGPFNISSVKIIELDHVSKTCILAVDLIKDTLEKQ